MADLIRIDGDGTPDKLAEAARNLRANLPRMIEHQKCVSQIIRARYTALLESGFTEQQALELCRAL